MSEVWETVPVSATFDLVLPDLAGQTSEETVTLAASYRPGGDGLRLTLCSADRSGGKPEPVFTEVQAILGQRTAEQVLAFLELCRAVTP